MDASQPPRHHLRRQYAQGQWQPGRTRILKLFPTCLRHSKLYLAQNASKLIGKALSLTSQMIHMQGFFTLQSFTSLLFSVSLALPILRLSEESSRWRLRGKGWAWNSWRPIPRRLVRSMLTRLRNCGLHTRKLVGLIDDTSNNTCEVGAGRIGRNRRGSWIWRYCTFHYDLTTMVCFFPFPFFFLFIWYPTFVFHGIWRYFLCVCSYITRTGFGRGFLCSLWCLVIFPCSLVFWDWSGLYFLGFFLISWLIGRLVLYLILFPLFVTDWALVGLGRFFGVLYFSPFLFSLWYNFCLHRFFISPTFYSSLTWHCVTSSLSISFLFSSSAWPCAGR